LTSRLIAIEDTIYFVYLAANFDEHTLFWITEGIVRVEDVGVALVFEECTTRIAAVQEVYPVCRQNQVKVTVAARVLLDDDISARLLHHVLVLLAIERD
jgi:hypothetical protein